jgi:hypothetical protein
VKKLAFSLTILAAGLLALPRTASAEPYFLSLNLLAGVGGSLDGEPSSGFGNPNFELGLLIPTDINTMVALRIGQTDLSKRSSFEGLENAKFQYVTIDGEYRFVENYYMSGLFIGLGAYKLGGDLPGGGHDDETQIGLHVGVDGEFPITRRMAVVVQLAGHYVNFSDRAQMYANAQLGLAIHF